MSYVGCKRAILLHLHVHGDDIPANIAETCKYQTGSISNAIQDLVDEEMVLRKFDRPIYTLSIDGESMARKIINQEQRLRQKQE